jgi:hypothetical protein
MIKLAFGPMTLRMAFLRVFGYGMKWKGSLFEYILFTNAEKKKGSGLERRGCRQNTGGWKT